MILRKINFQERNLHMLLPVICFRFVRWTNLLTKQKIKNNKNKLVNFFCLLLGKQTEARLKFMNMK